jgi:hypothetical protein
MRVERGPRAAPGTAPPPVYLPATRFLRLASLGYENVVGDLLWFRTISYFGEHYRSDRTYPWLAHMCDRVTDLDRRAWHVYAFGGMILPWEADQVDAGLRLLEKGVAAFPSSWKLYYWLGFHYYLFKDDYTLATQYLERAMELPGCDPYVARLLSALHQHQYGPRSTLEFLANLAANAGTEEVRLAIEQRKQEAQLAADIEDIQNAMAEYRRRFGNTPTALQDLVRSGVLSSLPRPPFGGEYRIDPETNEVVTSTGHHPSRLYRSKRGEALLRRARSSAQREP